MCWVLAAWLAVGAALAPADVTLVNAGGLSDSVKLALQKIAARAGDNEIAISSRDRTPKQQVEIMIDYYIECNATDKNTKARKATGQCGADVAKSVYHDKCDPAIDHYKPATEQTRAATVKAMTDALEQTLKALGDDRPCMMHVAVPGIALRNVALDVRPSSVDDPAKFYDAVMASDDVVLERFFYPPIQGKPHSRVRDSAFHLEFPRD